MDRLLRLVGLVVLPLLVGCIPVPVGSKYPPALVGESALESMIGENNESILVSLGSPGVVLSSETSTYYIYGAHGSEYQALLMVWVPVAGQESPKGKLFCVLLEFDDEKIFRRYKIIGIRNSGQRSITYQTAHCRSSHQKNWKRS